jgi:isopenicillin N synthase-like dioxygenase
MIRHVNKKFVNEISKAFEDIGFVALKGIFRRTLVRSMAMKFFSQPLETKYGYEIPELWTTRLCFFEQNMQREEKKAI